MTRMSAVTMHFSSCLIGYVGSSAADGHKMYAVILLIASGIVVTFPSIVNRRGVDVSSIRLNGLCVVIVKWHLTTVLLFIFSGTVCTFLSFRFFEGISCSSS